MGLRQLLLCTSCFMKSTPRRLYSRHVILYRVIFTVDLDTSERDRQPWLCSYWCRQQNVAYPANVRRCIAEMTRFIWLRSSAVMNRSENSMSGFPPKMDTLYMLYSWKLHCLRWSGLKLRRLVLYLCKLRNKFYQATKADMFLCNSHKFDVTLFHLTLSFVKGGRGRDVVDKTNVQVELSTFCVNARWCACEVMQRTTHLGRVLMH